MDAEEFVPFAEEFFQLLADFLDHPFGRRVAIGIGDHLVIGHGEQDDRALAAGGKRRLRGLAQAGDERGGIEAFRRVRRGGGKGNGADFHAAHIHRGGGRAAVEN